MITTLGCALIIRGFAQALWGVHPQRFPSLFGDEVLGVAGVRVPVVQLATLGVTSLIVAVMALYLQRSQSGLALRAAAEDLETVRLMGVPRDRLIQLAYGLSGVIGVAAGILFASTYNIVYLTMGFDGLIQGFIAAVIGGLGRISGALAGGLLLGVVSSLVGAYVTTAFESAVAYALLILVLIVRPTGLFAARSEARV